MKSCGFLVLTFTLFAVGGDCLQINELVVPNIVENGSKSAVVLDCDYSLNNTETDLVVKWYLNNGDTPVYQWIPPQMPQDLGKLKICTPTSCNQNTNPLAYPGYLSDPDTLNNALSVLNTYYKTQSAVEPFMSIQQIPVNNFRSLVTTPVPATTVYDPVTAITTFAPKITNLPLSLPGTSEAVFPPDYNSIVSYLIKLNELSHMDFMKRIRDFSSTTLGNFEEVGPGKIPVGKILDKIFKGSAKSSSAGIPPPDVEMKNVSIFLHFSLQNIQYTPASVPVPVLSQQVPFLGIPICSTSKLKSSDVKIPVYPIQMKKDLPPSRLSPALINLFSIFQIKKKSYQAPERATGSLSTPAPVPSSPVTPPASPVSEISSMKPSFQSPESAPTVPPASSSPEPISPKPVKPNPVFPLLTFPASPILSKPVAPSPVPSIMAPSVSPVLSIPSVAASSVPGHSVSASLAAASPVPAPSSISEAISSAPALPLSAIPSPFIPQVYKLQTSAIPALPIPESPGLPVPTPSVFALSEPAPARGVRNVAPPRVSEVSNALPPPPSSDTLRLKLTSLHTPNPEPTPNLREKKSSVPMLLGSDSSLLPADLQSTSSSPSSLSHVQENIIPLNPYDTSSSSSTEKPKTEFLKKFSQPQLGTYTFFYRQP